MITCYDPEYKLTKKILRGEAAIDSLLAALAEWIASKWSVRVLNVVYTGRTKLHAPCLEVVLEHEQEREVFRKGTANVNQRKASVIAERFEKLVDSHRDPPSTTSRFRKLVGSPKYDTEGLVVVFSAFAPLAREEADAAISDDEVSALQEQLNSPDLWCISRLFSYVTFMFYTEAQAERSVSAGLRETYAQRYFELLKPHDEFGYLSAENFAVRFDSRENFDKNYEGSWFTYYR